MKVAIMQPYFFPYLGYFSLIKHTDKFILFDPVQFIRHGWIERNRVLKQNDGWLYIKLPILNKTRDITIKELLLDNSQNWKEKIISQLQTYKKVAPYYSKVMNVITEIFSKKYEYINEINFESIKVVCQYLNIDSNLFIYSKLGLIIEEVKAPDEWALNICKELGYVSEYWNPPGGKSFFHKSKYDTVGIELKFQTIELIEYDQKRANFEKGLSIIDVMMFNSPEKINLMLDNYTIS